MNKLAGDAHCGESKADAFAIVVQGLKVGLNRFKWGIGWYGRRSGIQACHECTNQKYLVVKFKEWLMHHPEVVDHGMKFFDGKEFMVVKWKSR